MARGTLILGAALAVAGCTSDSDTEASTGGAGGPGTNGGVPGTTADASAGSDGEAAQTADDPGESRRTLADLAMHVARADAAAWR